MMQKCDGRGLFRTTTTILFVYLTSEAVQGDLLLRHYEITSSRRRRLPRAATSNIERLWPGNMIPYDFASTLSGQYGKHVKMF